MKRSSIVAAFSHASPAVRAILTRELTIPGDRYDRAREIDTAIASAIFAECDAPAQAAIVAGAQVRANKFRHASAEARAEMIAYDTECLTRKYAQLPSILAMLLEVRHENHG